MSEFTRREFLKAGARLAALMGLGAGAVPRVAEALQELAAENPPVLWLQGQSCSGCSVSLLNTVNPDPTTVLTSYISLLFHQTLSAATGEMCMEIVRQSIDRGGYLLAVEGSVPASMPKACIIGHETMASLLEKASQKAKAVLAVGSCAAYGGVPSAENNPTGAVSVPRYLESQGIEKPTIRLPGCPAHPDWIVGTLVHVIGFGLPPLDEEGRPQMFYSKRIHDQCPRFADYERQSFARHFSDDGCLFKLGCLGPLTHADCTLRQWNNRTNTCIRAGAPCIGCASKEFAARQSFPMYCLQTMTKTERG